MANAASISALRQRESTLQSEGGRSGIGVNEHASEKDNEIINMNINRSGKVVRVAALAESHHSAGSQKRMLGCNWASGAPARVGVLSVSARDSSDRKFSSSQSQLVEYFSTISVPMHERKGDREEGEGAHCSW